MSVWTPFKYGWNNVYAVKIEGISTIFGETATGLSMPSGYAYADALVIDESARIGQRVDRDKGIGVGFPLTFQISDCAEVRALLKASTVQTYLTSELTATVTTLNVKDSSIAVAGDYLHLGLEQIKVGAVAAGQFTGCTRGVSGYKYGHKVGDAGSILQDTPAHWDGRLVTLYAVPIDPTGYCPGTTFEGAAEVIWRGHISAGPDRSATVDMWSFEALPLDRLLALDLSSNLTGVVRSQDMRFNPGPNWWLFGHVTAWNGAAKVFDHDFALSPFGGLAPTTLITGEQFRSAISDEWADLVTKKAWGATQDALVWKSWDYSDKFGQINKQSWNVGFTFAANANVTSVYVDASMPGAWESHAYTQDTTATGGIATDEPFYTTLFWSQTMQANKPITQDIVNVELDDADAAADVQDDGYVRLGELVYRYRDAYADGAVVYLTHLRDLGGETPVMSLSGLDAEIIRIDVGPVVDVMLRALMSSGTGERSAAYDILGELQGYGLDEGLVDVTGIAEALGGFLQYLQVEFPSDGASLEGSLCQLLALSGRALVGRQVQYTGDAVDDSRAYRLTCVDTAAVGGVPAYSVTDADILASESTPVKMRRRSRPFARVVVEGEIAGKKTFRLTTRDRSRRQGGDVELSYKIPVGAGVIEAMAAAWSRARLVDDDFVRELTIRVVPWVDGDIGDVYLLDDISHYAVVDPETAQSGGYTAAMRCLESSIGLRMGDRQLTLVGGGHRRTSTLCPSALILATDNVNNPTWLDIDLKYASFYYALFQAETSTDLTLYDPGSTELGTDPWGYTVTGIEPSGVLPTYARLTVAAKLDGAEVITLGTSRVVTSKDGNASTFETDHLMFDNSGDRWGAG